MKVEIWSDVVCPWCYIGKRRFESALEGFDEEVEVVWRSFELDPGAPRHPEGASNSTSVVPGGETPSMPIASSTSLPSEACRRR